eukprot:scaffold10573_cov109-Isochrysis_galbana.AAC.3
MTLKANKKPKPHQLKVTTHQYNGSLSQLSAEPIQPSHRRALDQDTRAQRPACLHRPPIPYCGRLSVLSLGRSLASGRTYHRNNTSRLPRLTAQPCTPTNIHLEHVPTSLATPTLPAASTHYPWFSLAMGVVNAAATAAALAGGPVRAILLGLFNSALGARARSGAAKRRTPATIGPGRTGALRAEPGRSAALVSSLAAS